MPETRQMTAVQHASERVEHARANMLQDVDGHRAEIERFLAVFDIDYEFFVAGLRIFLVRQARENADFFLKLTDTSSFIEALLRIAMNGCIPDGKEAAIAVYKGVATAMFMRDGFVKVLWRTGLVKSINDQTVTVNEYEAGRFEYEEGDQGFITHRMDLMRKDSDTVAAAYCVIELTNGGVMREVVPMDELAKIRAMSKSPARGAWAHQMDRKAAIRRIMGKMPRAKGIAQLLADDEGAYDMARANAPAAEAPTHKDIFGGRPVRRKGKAIAHQPAEAMDLPMDTLTDEELVEEIMAEGRRNPLPPAEREALKEKILDTIETNEAKRRAEPEFILQAIISTKNGLQQFAPAEAEFWFGDIQQKMKSLEGDALKSFWAKNHGFIEEAGRNGHAAYAMKLVALADELGLIQRGGQ